MDYKLLDDVDTTKMYDEYYCANVVEKLYKCEAKLTYVKNGGFGLNYKYCRSCYAKWWADKEKEKNIKKESKCLIKIDF